MSKFIHVIELLKLLNFYRFVIAVLNLKGNGDGSIRVFANNSGRKYVSEKGFRGGSSPAMLFTPRIVSLGKIGWRIQHEQNLISL